MNIRQHDAFSKSPQLFSLFSQNYSLIYPGMRKKRPACLGSIESLDGARSCRSPQGCLITDSRRSFEYCELSMSPVRNVEARRGYGAWHSSWSVRHVCALTYPFLRIRLVLPFAIVVIQSMSKLSWLIQRHDLLLEVKVLAIGARLANHVEDISRACMQYGWRRELRHLGGR